MVYFPESGGSLFTKTDLTVPERQQGLRILYVEDNRTDRELVAAILAGDGLRCELIFVETESQLKMALANSRFDVILSDFTLPCFDGAATLALVRKAMPEVPFLFVSGTIGEERAVESLKSGATDFILKEHLTRLPAAIWRALREAQRDAERKRVIEALRESEERFRQVTESINEVFWLSDISKNQIIYVSPAYERIWGHTCVQPSENGSHWSACRRHCP